VKTAKRNRGRPLLTFTFSDGEVSELDAAETLRKIALQWEKLNGATDPHVGIYRSEADRLESLHRRALAKSGGDATKHGADVTHKDLDDAILACWARGEPTRRYVKTWQQVHAVSKDTIYRRINRLKPK
jgi:hypothetical protein